MARMWYGYAAAYRGGGVCGRVARSCGNATPGKTGEELILGAALTPGASGRATPTMHACIEVQLFPDVCGRRVPQSWVVVASATTPIEAAALVISAWWPST